VVRDDLLLLGNGVAGHAFEPVGEAFVQVGALCLRDRFVGRIADQEVSKPERDIARHRAGVGPDQLLADERHEVA
jgi:hypothetical protein